MPTETEVERRYCHFIVSCSDITEPPQSSDIVTVFQRGSLEEKKEKLKTLLKLIINDENYPRLIMPVLTNLQQLQDHSIKKLLFLYWEIIEKTNVDGTLKEELILACNALRKDLLSPNEFVRGRTLRLVSKISLKSILENLMEAVSQNLTHRHFYVRRNALMCIYNVFQNTGMELVEDFVDDIEKLAQTENDLSTKRNAFILLFQTDQGKALAYLKTIMANEDDPIYEMGDIFQLAILEMLRKICKVDPTQKSRLMNAIFILSSSKSSSVLLECANTIIQLTTAPTAVKVAIQSYLSLLQEQNDNNVKLIVLNKILSLKKQYGKLLQDYIQDVLNIIREDSVQSIEINQKVLELVTELASPRNIKEVTQFLVKEIYKARKLDDSHDKTGGSSEASMVAPPTSAALSTTSSNEYRYLLIKSINQISQLFPETIPEMICPLMESFLKFEKKGSMASLETIIFIREIVQVYPQYKTEILAKLVSILDEIRNHLVLRVAVWIVGEYSSAQPELDAAFEAIQKNIGSLPIFIDPVQQEEEKKQAQATQQEGPKVITKTIIMPDGSYGTETIVVDQNSKADQSSSEENLSLRKALKNADDDFLASCVAISLTKLVIKTKKNLQIKKFNAMAIETSLIICALTKNYRKAPDHSNLQRMQVCLKILTSPKLLKSISSVQKILADQGQKIFSKFLESNSRLIREKKADTNKLVITQPDEAIVFRQLRGRAAVTEFDITEEISDALGGDTQGYDDFLGDIKKDIDSKVYQLTGFSDPIYAEAFVEVHHYDILLRIVLINRTKKTLPNINFEILPGGSLKVVERPIPFTLKPEATATLKASLKVSSTDNGIIFGYLTYDSANGAQPQILNINEIPIDFINELQQAKCSELEFKKKWAEYEWENKVQVNTTMTDLKEFVDHFAKELNVSLMTKLEESDKRGSFLVANFYTKSKFEEDCLLNLSIEKVNLARAEQAALRSDVKISGLIRLRAKTEGMALCVGEKCKLVR